MAAPLIFFAAGQLLRAAGPRIAKEIAKFAVKATKKQIKAGGKPLTVNNSNLGVVRTASRPKAGGAAPKTTPAKPKTSGSGSGSAPKKTTPKKPTASGAAKKAPKKAPKQAPKKSELKPDPKDAPKSAQTRAAKAKTNANKAAKKSPFGTRPQRALILAATTAPALFPSGSNRDKAEAKNTTPNYRAGSQGGRKRGEGPTRNTNNGETFGAAFARARKKGVGTDFTFKGKKFKAVRDDDIPASIKGNKQERLRKFLNQRKKKGS